jgi:hypothetical protein
MRSFLGIALLLLSLTSVLAQQKRVGRFSFQTEKGQRTARIVFHVRSFDSSKHRVAYDDSIGNTVDGRKAYGAEGIPEAEIASIQFFLNGKAVHIPKKLYSDCYDPNLRENPVTIKFAPDNSALLVSIWGSDGAGGYNVVWKLRANGRHTRVFKSS